MNLENLTIAVENSTWNNIGDAFYQTSLLHALKKALRGARVVHFDGPPDRAFRPIARVQSNVFDIREKIRADHVVFSGPILARDFFVRYAPLIEALKSRGSSYSLMSAHAYAAGDDLIQLRKFLTKHPPIAFHSRDHSTFEKFKGIAPVEMDGICFAFFVSKIPDIPDFDVEDYICMSFHSRSDPHLECTSLDVLLSRPVSFPKKPAPRLWRVTRHFEHFFYGSRQSTGMEIVRPVHGFYPFSHLIFSRPNSFISYNPSVFLGVYKSCSATITDRVHAGVASLSFGNPAIVAELDGRFELFEKAPVLKRDGWFHLDPARLETCYSQVHNWLESDFAGALTSAHPNKAYEQPEYPASHESE